MANGRPPIRKANTIKDVYYAVSNARALSVEELDKFYYDTDPVRSDVSAKGRLAKIIRKSAHDSVNSHILFVGARGAGKSTELNYLQKELQDDFAVINYSVMEELDPQSINYIELFIVTMEKLFKYAEVNTLNIKADFLKRITDWTNTKEIETVKEKHLSAEVTAGLKGKIGLPYLLELFAEFKGTAKASRSFKETLKDHVEPRLGELIRLCNELFTEIRIAIRNLGKGDLLIIIEDLDKVQQEVATGLFIRHAEQLVSLQANIIYTYPVALYYNARYNAVINYFSRVMELPMIKVRGLDGAIFEEGVQALTFLVHNRINAALFADNQILRNMILMTGGVLWDLFRMIDDAADYAEEKERAVIGNDEYRYAYRQLLNQYRNTIADYRDDNGTLVKATEFYTALAELANSTEKKPENTDALLMLRQNLCVLTYNGENWCDVHPAVKETLREKGLLN